MGSESASKVISASGGFIFFEYRLRGGDNSHPFIPIHTGVLLLILERIEGKAKETAISINLFLPVIAPWIFSSELREHNCCGKKEYQIVGSEPRSSPNVIEI